MPRHAASGGAAAEPTPDADAAGSMQRERDRLRAECAWLGELNESLDARSRQLLAERDGHEARCERYATERDALARRLRVHHVRLLALALTLSCAGQIAGRELWRSRVEREKAPAEHDARPAATPPPPVPPEPTPGAHARDTGFNVLRALYPAPIALRVTCETPNNDYWRCLARVGGRLMALECHDALMNNQGCRDLHPVPLPTEP